MENDSVLLDTMGNSFGEKMAANDPSRIQNLNLTRANGPDPNGTPHTLIMTLLFLLHLTFK